MKWGLKRGARILSRLQPASLCSPGSLAQGGLRRKDFHLDGTYMGSSYGGWGNGDDEPDYPAKLIKEHNPDDSP